MRRMTAVGALLSVCALNGVPTLMAQDQGSKYEITKRVATFPEAFSTISGLRVLSDGRLLVADALGEVLVAIDLAAGTADTIGRRGQGPEEYIQPDGVFPLPGDSTLLVDLGNGRLTVIGPELSFGETSPIAVQADRGMVIILPRGVDAQGRVYFQPSGFGGGRRPGSAFPDSGVVARWDRATGVIDTLAWVKLQEVSIQTGGSGNNRDVRVTQQPMSLRDGWNVGQNGRIALVRSGDYHVEWVNGSSIVRGRSVSYRAVPIRQADKEEWADAASGGLRIGIDIDNGQRRVSLGRGGAGSSRRRDLDQYDWPDVKPPFSPNDVFVTPEGAMWVRRNQPAGRAPLFDVFDEAGNLTSQVVLPIGRRIVGFGEGTVYLAANDEFDLQWLEQYERPAT